MSDNEDEIAPRKDPKEEKRLKWMEKYQEPAEESLLELQGFKKMIETYKAFQEEPDSKAAQGAYEDAVNFFSKEVSSKITESETPEQRMIFRQSLRIVLKNPHFMQYTKAIFVPLETHVKKVLKKMELDDKRDYAAVKAKRGCIKKAYQTATGETVIELSSSDEAVKPRRRAKDGKPARRPAAKRPAAKKHAEGSEEESDEESESDSSGYGGVEGIDRTRQVFPVLTVKETADGPEVCVEYWSPDRLVHAEYSVDDVVDGMEDGQFLMIEKCTITGKRVLTFEDFAKDAAKMYLTDKPELVPLLQEVLHEREVFDAEDVEFPECERAEYEYDENLKPVVDAKGKHKKNLFSDVGKVLHAITKDMELPKGTPAAVAAQYGDEGVKKLKKFRRN